LLLLLFGEQPENSTALGYVGRSVKKKTVMLNILPSDELVHGSLPFAFVVVPPQDAVLPLRGRAKSSAAG
jgi:hypothetical protein